MKYNIGDFVVYPMQGTGKITGIVAQEEQEKIVQYYNVRFLYGEMDLKIPVENVDFIGVRQPMDKEEIPKVLAYLKTSELMQVDSNWNRRQQENLKKLKSGSIYDVADVFKFLYYRDGIKALSTGEKRYYTTAARFIAGEISVSGGFSLEEAEDMVMKALKGE